MKRTPGKWEVFEIGDEIEIWADAKQVDKGVFVQVMGRRVCGDFDSNQDAAYIVRAVNCHERLVEVAKEYVDLLESMAINHGDMVQCRKLIAEVEGGGNE